MITRLPAPLQADPRARLREVRSTLTSLRSPSETGRLDSRLLALRISIENAQAIEKLEAEEGDAVDALARGGQFAPQVTVPVGSPLTADTTQLAGRALEAASVFVFVFTVGAAIVILLAGLLTVVQTVYEPNETFADFWDYWALFAASFASSAVAGIVGLLAWWQVKPETATR